MMGEKSRDPIVRQMISEGIKEAWRNGVYQNQREKNTERDQLIIEYYSDGATMRECAKKFGLSLERIRVILRNKAPDIIRPARKRNKWW